MTRRRGFMFLDMLVGLSLLTAVAVVLAVTVGQQARAAQRLGDSREAARRAESVLIDLQSGRAAPKDPDVRLQPIGAAQGSADLQWTRVRVTVNNRSAEVVGLTRRTP